VAEYSIARVIRLDARIVRLADEAGSRSAANGAGVITGFLAAISPEPMSSASPLLCCHRLDPQTGCVGVFVAGTVAVQLLPVGGSRLMKITSECQMLF
jgi:hypothetical protein